MLHASTQQLIRKLHELTEAGALAWKAGERQTARLDTEGYIVEVDATPPTIRLLRADGRELETAAADDLAAVAWPGGDGTYATRVGDIARRASRIARGGEQPTATPLSSLSAPARIPSPAAATGSSGSPVQRALLAPFGATRSFAAPTVSAATAAAQPPARKAPPDMAAQGISARTAQGGLPASTMDLQRLIAGPTPAAKPVRAPSATGPNVYKPWS